MPHVMLDRRALLAGTAACLAAPGLAWASEGVSMALGSARLRVVSDGSFPLPPGALAPGIDRTELAALLGRAGESGPPARSVLNVTALVEADGVVLFDCGAGANFMEGAGQLAKSLEAAGIDAGQVKHVCFTHAHPDHLWGALDDFDTPAYPNATYHIAAAEWDTWFAPDIYTKLPEDRHAFAAGAQRVLKILEPQLRRFVPGSEVAPGIAAVEAGGHTPGHVAFEVRRYGTAALVAGDALTHAVVSFQRPDWPGAFDQDRDAAAATRKRLLDKLAAERMPLIGYHLSGGGLGRVERDGSAYRFVPGA